LRNDWLIPTPVTLQGGDEAFSAAWARGDRPTAVLAVSDIIAMGAMRAARRLGVRVPEDLEVIGFDDIPIAAASQPPLSTVHQPIPEKGRVAIRLLIRELDEGGPRERIVLPTELVLRESTRTLAMPATDENAGVTKGGSESETKRSLTRAAGNQAAF
jgi:DNA-binding LacI/PurR family transcriptional regulator